MATLGHPTLLNCTRCECFREFERDSENVVRCDDCGKRHSTDSLFVADPEKEYERDEAGELQEVPP